MLDGGDDCVSQNATIPRKHPEIAGVRHGIGHTLPPPTAPQRHHLRRPSSLVAFPMCHSFGPDAQCNERSALSSPVVLHHLLVRSSSGSTSRKLAATRYTSVTLPHSMNPSERPSSFPDRAARGGSLAFADSSGHHLVSQRRSSVGPSRRSGHEVARRRTPSAELILPTLLGFVTARLYTQYASPIFASRSGMKRILEPLAGR